MTKAQKIKKRFYFLAARYFRFFAARALRRWHPRVIAITGSVGKTTMLHLIESTLGKKAHYSHDANSAFGIAFDLVGLRGVYGSKLRWLYLIFAVPIRSLYFKHTEKFYVVEIDGERPHEAEFLASWLQPEVTLWISLGRSHAVQFENQVKSGLFASIDEAIAHEFSTLPAHTQKCVFINGDNPLMVKSVAGISASVQQFSMQQLKSYSVYPDHTDYTIKPSFVETISTKSASASPSKSTSVETVSTKSSAKPSSAKTATSSAKPLTFHFAQPQPRDLAIQLSMLAALAAYLKIPVRTDLSALPVPPGRSTFFEGINGLNLIDSSYNAHLISMTAILEMVRDMPIKHKWLVLGDMVEQGSIESEEHAKLADLIATVQPEQVILIGRRTKKYTAPRLVKQGITPYATSDPRHALQFILDNTTGGETLVFKGSQYLEWIIEKLLKNPADAARLPRREPAAVRRREKRGLDS